jgi:hypothetical protein
MNKSTEMLKPLYKYVEDLLEISVGYLMHLFTVGFLEFRKILWCMKHLTTRQIKTIFY